MGPKAVAPKPRMNLSLTDPTIKCLEFLVQRLIENNEH
jgi:hypothetical protein